MNQSSEYDEVLDIFKGNSSISPIKEFETHTIPEGEDFDNPNSTIEPSKLTTIFERGISRMDELNVSFIDPQFNEGIRLEVDKFANFGEFYTEFIGSIDLDEHDNFFKMVESIKKHVSSTTSQDDLEKLSTEMGTSTKGLITECISNWLKRVRHDPTR